MAMGFAEIMSLSLAESLPHFKRTEGVLPPPHLPQRCLGPLGNLSVIVFGEFTQCGAYFPRSCRSRML